MLWKRFEGKITSLGGNVLGKPKSRLTEEFKQSSTIEAKLKALVLKQY